MMKPFLNKILAALLCFLIAMNLASCSAQPETEEPSLSEEEETKISSRDPDTKILTLSGDTAYLDGVFVEEFDYTWHCDPTVSHDEVKNAPAEYYTGTKPKTNDAVFIDHDLPYFPELPEEDFKLIRYDGEEEWAYYYKDGVNDSYIFATLPKLGNELPSQMMHSETEASENKVLHITKAGTYLLEGEWKGQILVDLGDKDEVFADESAKVTLILQNVSIECTVAPGIVFSHVYECDNGWEERETYSENVSAENAGAVILLADGSENRVSGTNIARMLKTTYKSEDPTEEIPVQKKLRKTDGALYSYMSLNIDGEKDGTGTLTVESGNEGICSELHLSLLGGNIEIYSQDDGINVNEDNVSVVGFYGGTVTLHAGLGTEGDGVDSNGYIVLDGGTVIAEGIVPPDSALDSEKGAYYRSGTVIIDGAEQNYEPGTVIEEIGAGGMPFGENEPGFRPDDRGKMPMGANENFDMKEFKEKIAALSDDANLDDVLSLLGMGEPFGEKSPENAVPPEPPENGMPQNP